MSEQFRSYRCSLCNLNYPPRYPYTKCMKCGEKTWASTTSEPMSTDEAAAIQADENARQTIVSEIESKHRAFERYIAERDKEQTAVISAQFEAIMAFNELCADTKSE